MREGPEGAKGGKKGGWWCHFFHDMKEFIHYAGDGL